MGIYLNPGNASFSEALRSKIYVDKTGLIEYTNEVFGTKQKNICVSRPRRFGKSMAAEMLAAYYGCDCESKGLFHPLRIAGHPSFETYLNSCDVLFLNMQSFLSRSGSALHLVEYVQKAVIMELREKYPALVDAGETHLSVALEKIYDAAKKGFVVIIDEWDCIFREKKHDIAAQTSYLDFLRDLLKDKPYVKLAYMTGILPIKKYGTHSALNMFDEFSMTNPKGLAEYVGFTEQEVMRLCAEYGMDFLETKRWYDGYRFRRTEHVYSPKSVVDAMRNQEFDNYWTQTETYEALKRYIDMNFDGLRDAVTVLVGDGRCRLDTGTFQNDMTSFAGRDDVLTLLIHLGYLAYDSTEKTVFIPNEEVRGEFVRAIKTGGWGEIIKAISMSEELLEATWQINSRAVADGIDQVHTEAASILSYNNENALSCVISLAYYSARSYYTVIREFPSGKGFADLVFLPHPACFDKPAMIIELKWDKTAEGALRQIKEKEYPKALSGYHGRLLLVGINYDKKSKKHQCMIEVQTI